LLNNILFSAKNDNMDIVVEETVFDFHRLLHDTCLLLNGQRSERPILLSAECSPDVPQHLRADSGKIRQILLNLAGNALKFTKQGNIRIAATRVLPADPDTAERPDSLALCVTVSDTGCGIPKTFLPRLFQPFEQAEQTQAGASGVGLGLPISRRLARALGGDIGVSSAVGQGSTFQFTFLAHSVDASPFDEHRELCTLAEGEPRRRVLIVDDDDANRFMLADLLRGAGLESSPAADGQQAPCSTPGRCST
jgi:signal transduction histidine kinase